jgi:SAM-dependent methyltransferase
VAVDLDPARPADAVRRGEADEGFEGRAGHLDRLHDASFDVVLYRLVLHHIAYQGSLDPCFAEARRLLRPGGAMVAIEPGLWHPVGAALAAANRAGLGVRVHGTPDDVPLSPRVLAAGARRAGLAPELHAVTYGWRRLPVAAQRVLAPLDRLGSVPGLRAAGHTLMFLARR